MPLDSNLFADLETMVRWNVAGTFELPKDHPDKFDLSTPPKAWSAICRTWEHAPTSARIIEDIDRVFTSIEAVVAARGKAVDYGKVRHGRRLREHWRAEKAKVGTAFDDIEGLHPVAKQCIVDLTGL